jgi:hypothetical protein
MSKRHSEDRYRTDTMWIVVDGQCVEDFWKAGLFERVLQTSATVAVAQTVWAGQLQNLPANVRADFMELGLQVVISLGTHFKQAMSHMGRFPALNAAESYSLVVAEARADSILVAADPQLRDAANAILPTRLRSSTWLVTILDQTPPQPEVLRRSK